LTYVFVVFYVQSVHC